jgi:hypothetical protein
LLMLEARVRAHRGDWTGAAEAIEAIHRLAGSLEYEPILVSQLVRIAVNGMGRGTLQALLPHAEWTDQEMARLQASLERIDYGPAMVRTMQGERAWGIDIFHNPHKLSELGVKDDVSDGRLGLQHDDLLFYLDTMERFVAAVRLPAPANLDTALEIDAEVKGTLGGAGAVTQPRYAISSVLLPALWQVPQAGLRGDAQNRAAAAAIACERFRRAEGRLPKSLDELAPKYLAEVPIDPFDGKPLRYVVEDDGFKVYSVGQDRTDDGGRFDEENPAEGDLVFPVRWR